MDGSELRPEVDLYCPRAVASALKVRADGNLFRAEVAVTVRVEAKRLKEDVKVDARLRVHRIEGTRAPIQDLPFDVESRSLDREKGFIELGLRAEFTISDPAAKLIALVGVALHAASIQWPSRDQVVAERALSSSHLYTTLKGEFKEDEPVTLDDADVLTLDSDDAATLDPDTPESMPLFGTVVISGDEREPPLRMTLSVDNQTSLAAWTVPWELRGKRSLTVVIKATCDIHANGTPATVRNTTEAPSADVFNGGDPGGTLVYPSDYALLKNRADVILVGRAYAPAGRASRSEMVFRFGSGDNRFQRRIAVFGAREWVDGTPSPPQLFRYVPLIYERAFGGPGYADNPVGVGYGKSHRGRFVPSLEDPAELVQKRGDKANPACTAAISPTWDPRWTRVGRTWRRRLEQTWDELADDFNWDFFQCAPEPQQLDYLAGDEPFEALGTRPGDAALRGALPGIRPRCTATGKRGSRPVPLNLDTVVIDAETLTLHIVWRGLVSLSAAKPPDLEALLVTL